MVNFLDEGKFWYYFLALFNLEETNPNLLKSSVSAATLIANDLPMQRVQSYCSSCTHGCLSEFRYCDMHIMQLLKVIGMTSEQTPHKLIAFSKV